VLSWDWGGFAGGAIAGLFTLGGGVLAYVAGVMQARATKEAGEASVAVVKAQLEQERAIFAERQKAAIRSLVAALSTEGNRSKMVLTECLKSLDRRAPDFAVTVVPEVAKTYDVRPEFAIRAALVADPGIDESTKGAAFELYARLDNLTALIDIRAKYVNLTFSDLKEALEVALVAADGLAKAASVTLARE
jgi:hypothetical protein